MNSTLTARLAHLEVEYGPYPPRTKAMITELVDEAALRGVAAPSALFGEPGGDIHAVWQGAENRVTVYTEDDTYEIEVVPRGPVEPFNTSKAETTVAYLAGLFVNFGPLDAETNPDER